MSTGDTESSHRNKTTCLWICCFAVLLIVLWMIPAAIGYYSFDKWEERGQFGDLFGATNALFSGLAMGGVIYAVHLQRLELALQRKQSQDAEAEQKASELAREKQHFEASFFQFVGALTNLLQATEIVKTTNGSPSPVYGRRAIKILYDELHDKLKGGKEVSPSERMQSIGRIYNSFHDRFSAALPHYFRLLYRTLRFVEDSSPGDEMGYAKIVRSLLSSQELNLIFYDCLSEHGTKMKRLVEKYALLKHVSTSTLAMPSDRGFFNPSAFSDGSPSDSRVSE